MTRIPIQLLKKSQCLLATQVAFLQLAGAVYEKKMYFQQHLLYVNNKRKNINPLKVMSSSEDLIKGKQSSLAAIEVLLRF